MARVRPSLSGRAVLNPVSGLTDIARPNAGSTSMRSDAAQMANLDPAALAISSQNTPFSERRPVVKVDDGAMPPIVALIGKVVAPDVDAIAEMHRSCRRREMRDRAKKGQAENVSHFASHRL